MVDHKVFSMTDIEKDSGRGAHIQCETNFKNNKHTMSLALKFKVVYKM